MKITISKKLVGSFFVMTLVVVAAGLTGLIMVNRVAQSGDVVVEEKVPFKDVAMEAIISSERAVGACRNYLLAETGLSEIEGEINEYIGDFDMFISMFEYGTESEEFQSSPAGKMYVKDGLNIKVPRVTDEMLVLVEKISEHQSAFTDRAKELVKTHKDRVQYSFTYNGVHYDLPAFLYTAEIKHRRWFEGLQNAVEYEVDFTGELDPAKCFFGTWYTSYRSEDKEMTALLDKLKSLHVKIHKTAADTLSVDEGQRESMLKRASRYKTKIHLGFGKLQKYAEAKIVEFERKEQMAVTAMFEASEKMISVLEQLEGIADHGMNLAQENAKQSKAIATHTLLAMMPCAFILAMVLGFFITRSITKPVKTVVDGLKDIAEGEGDLTKRLELKSQDEIGELAKWFNTFMEKLQGIIKDIAGNAESLDSSSNELSAISQQMSSGSEQTSSKANTVATATEEMSSNMSSVAAASEEASTNVGMVATASEQMTGVINEIAQNTEKARTITGEAVSQAVSASEKVDELGRAANEIGKVTETITEISEQTNLLALNATIEAARAGEAGKGFAVVANEIKDLAKQTAEATGEIKNKIEGIQGSTEGTVTQIEQISKVINDVNEMVGTIATAVEEQSVTTKEIARNVVQASQGIQEVTENVAQSSTVAGEIARDITEVNQAAGEMSNSSSQVNMSAEELSKLAEQLKEMVGKFKV